MRGRVGSRRFLQIRFLSFPAASFVSLACSSAYRCFLLFGITAQRAEPSKQLPSRADSELFNWLVIRVKDDDEGVIPLLVRRGGCGIKKISAKPTLAPQTEWSLTINVSV